MEQILNRYSKNRLGKYIKIDVLLYVLFIAVLCIVLSLKVDFFVDEIFTYGKANCKTPVSFQEKEGAGAVYIPIKDGKIYTPGGKPLMDYVVVQPDNRFYYVNVWKLGMKLKQQSVKSMLRIINASNCYT